MPIVRTPRRLRQEGGFKLKASVGCMVRSYLNTQTGECSVASLLRAPSQPLTLTPSRRGSPWPLYLQLSSQSSPEDQTGFPRSKSKKEGPVCPKRKQSGRCGGGALSRPLLNRWHQVCWRRWLFSNCHSDPQMSVVSTGHFVSVWPLSCQTIRLPSPVGTGRHRFKERKWLIRGHTASE